MLFCTWRNQAICLSNFDLSPGFVGVVEEDWLVIPAASLGTLFRADHYVQWLKPGVSERSRKVSGFLILARDSYNEKRGKNGIRYLN